MTSRNEADIATMGALLDRRQDALVRRLKRLVEINSGIDNPEGRLACLVEVESVYKMLGFACERVEKPGGLVHLVARRPALVPQGHGAPVKVLLLGHLDTVFDRDSTFLGCHREGPWLVGPGVGDMKGGLIVIQGMLEALAHARRLDDFDWVIVHNADEEVQSPTSRQLIEDLATDRDLCLNFEIGRSSGAVVRSRAGVGRYFIAVTGRATHAGIHHADGANAIVALSHIVTRLSELTDYAVGTTINVGTIGGGTKRNIVPDEAHCEVDVRIRRPAEGERIDGEIQKICAEGAREGIEVQVRGGIGRPPWRRGPASDRLVSHVLSVANDLGQKVGAEDTGGGSDSNYVAALGVPAVDGLGPVGQGVHTHDERIKLHTIIDRAKLSAAVVLNWSAEEPVVA